MKPLPSSLLSTLLTLPHPESAGRLRLLTFFKIQKDNYISNLQKNLNNFLVDRSIFFNCLEHLMYTAPIQILTDLIPPEYENFAKTNEYYKDIKNIFNKIWKNDVNEEIDCKGVIFLSKCHLKIVHFENFEKDKLFINELRKIKLGKKTAKRKGEYIKEKSNVVVVDYGNLTTLDKIRNQNKKIKNKSKPKSKPKQKGGNDMYSFFKNVYTKTNDPHYKILYEKLNYLS